MDTFHIWVLIRALVVLAMIGVLVTAGALSARRDTHRASNRDRDATPSPEPRPATTPRTFRFTTFGAVPEANDSQAPSAPAERRAA